MKLPDFSQRMLTAGLLVAGSLATSPATYQPSQPDPLPYYSSSSLSPTSEIQREVLGRFMEELEAVKRIHAFLNREGIVWGRDYVDQIKELFDALNNKPGPITSGLISYATMGLKLARQQLLDSVTRAKTWIQLAQAIQPEKIPVLPHRLIKPTLKKEVHQIDWVAIDTRIWSSTITIG